jgi:hypothetical protein
MGNWATVHSDRRRELTKINMRRKWPIVHYVEIVIITKDAFLVNFGLLEDTWIPKKTMFELNKDKKTFQTSRKLLEDKGIDVKSIEVLSPEKLRIRKSALMFDEWRKRNAEP